VLAMIGIGMEVELQHSHTLKVREDSRGKQGPVHARELTTKGELVLFRARLTCPWHTSLARRTSGIVEECLSGCSP
jgi:hypothetical protein